MTLKLKERQSQLAKPSGFDGNFQQSPYLKDY